MDISNQIIEELNKKKDKLVKRLDDQVKDLEKVKSSIGKLNVPELFYEINNEFSDLGEWEVKFSLGRTLLYEHFGKSDIELIRSANDISFVLDNIHVSFSTYRSRSIQIGLGDESLIKKPIKPTPISNRDIELYIAVKNYMKNKSVSNFKKVVLANSSFRKGIVYRCYRYNTARKICNQEFLDKHIERKERHERNMELYMEGEKRYIKEAKKLFEKIGEIENVIDLKGFLDNGYRVYYSSKIEKIKEDIRD